jgi:tetratricopeptide (TPR) repeat protein
MKINYAAIAIFSLCLTITAVGQQARLEGHLYEIVNAKETPVAGVRIISPGGQSKETDSKGHFVIDFPSSVQPGQATRIEVSRAGWLVRDPLFGECTTKTPARNFELLKVVIVPKGSPLALEPKQLSKVIARWADERVKLRGKVSELGRQLDEYAFLRMYAEKYGVTLDQFKHAADQWAKIKGSDDKEERALKEYWLKNYDRAALLAREAALTADEELERANKDRIEAGRKVIRRFQLEGNAFYELYKFRESLGAYNEIEMRFSARKLSKEDLIEEWVAIKVSLGIVKNELGKRVEGVESQNLLTESVREFRQALTVRTREQLSVEWAMMQHNLGTALSSQGERVSGEESVRLLAQAVEAFRQALIVYTREQLPQDWAGTQNGLGLALQRQGEQAGGEESVRLLTQAVEAYRQALTVYTREQLPQDWAGTQNNLGIALSMQGEQASGEMSVRLLAQAVEAYRQALTVYTREQLPQRWALTQNNLGSTLKSQGEHMSGEERVRLLAQAVEAFRQALTVRTREQLPQQWAMTQNNLGLALSSQGQQMSGEESVRLLAQAVEAFRQALTVRTREHLPQQWATTQRNLGDALSSQGERVSGEESVRLLAQAVEAFRQALTVYTREYLPRRWAMTQSNLGIALSMQGERVSGEESIRLLAQAVEAFRQALTVRTREQSPQEWAATQNNLGLALRMQGERVSGEVSTRLLSQAVETYRQALTVRTREQLPQDWAQTQNNLANAYFLLRNWLDAAESYANVLTVYPDEEEAYTRASALYHDVLFKFDKAFALNQQWLARHPDDISAQADFAEKQFTMARFDECERRINALLVKPEVSSSTKSALRAIEIADLSAFNQADKIPARMEALITEIARQPAEFKVGWVFDGTKHFIGQNEKLSPYREWLVKLFDAIGGKDRETIFKGLQEAKVSFKIK